MLAFEFKQKQPSLLLKLSIERIIKNEILQKVCHAGYPSGNYI